MIRFPSASARLEYVLADDRASEQPTVFVLRRLTSEEMRRVIELQPVPLRVAMRVEAIRQAAAGDPAQDIPARALTDQERAEIDRLMPDTDDAGRLARTAEQMGQAVAFGLVEVRNVAGEDGQPTTVTPQAFISGCTNLTWLVELGNAVIAFSTLAEADRKN